MIPPSASPERLDEPLVTVIVPCYNSERTIRQCLKSLINQQSSISFDIVVVDSSSDQTAVIVAKEFPKVRLIKLEERAFAGAARNVGIRETRAQFCLMIDSDCIAEPDLIERIIRRHLEGEFAAVGGSLRNGTPNSLSGWIGYLIEFKEFMPTTKMRLATNVPTANLAYRREVLERYGLFDEDLWPAEDLLFNWKLHTAGERLLFDPEIMVTHLNRTGWRTVLSYQVRLGLTSGIALKRRGGEGALAGGALVRYPVLIALLPFARLKNAVTWLARYDKKALMLLLLVWPTYFIAAGFWSFGFYRGVVDEK
jgi:glycosyltransferase involved in cell wall biosynthesis